MTIRSAVALVAGCVVLACDRAAPVTTLAVDGRSNENVTVAAAGDVVAVAWTATEQSTTDVFAAVSTDGGATFAAAVRVNATAGDARAGGEQPPQVALIPHGATPDIAVVWTAKRADGTRLLVARSTDAGKTFGATDVVRGSEAAGNRGWESVAIDSAGRVLALWLDHRNAVANAGAMHHHGDSTGVAPKPDGPKPDPVERAELSQLFFGIAGDSQPARGIAAGVCYCCKTALAASGNRVFAAWRHVFPGNQRDIAYASSSDGGTTFSQPIRASDDHWTFDGCPENGPSLAVDATNRVHIVWPTPVDGKADSPLALFYAMSVDGATFAPRVRVTDGVAVHARIRALPDGSLLVAWEDVASSARTIKLARGVPTAAGGATFTPTALAGDVSGAYPALAVTTGGAVVAWSARERSSGAGGTTRTVIRVARVRTN